MSNKEKPPQEVIDWLESQGFEYAVVTESIYTDKRDVPVHFFQTDNGNHKKICSTILASDATRLYLSLGGSDNDG